MASVLYKFIVQLNSICVMSTSDCKTVDTHLASLPHYASEWHLSWVIMKVGVVKVGGQLQLYNSQTQLHFMYMRSTSPTKLWYKQVQQIESTRVCGCQCACDTTDDRVCDVTVFCRVACVGVDELLSDVDIFVRAASASGKFGGVTGVFAGVRIYTTHRFYNVDKSCRMIKTTSETILILNVKNNTKSINKKAWDISLNNQFQGWPI